MTYQKRKNPSSDTFIKVRFIFKSHPKNRNNEEKTSKKKLPLQDFSISKATAPFLWEMQDYHEAPVLQMLHDKFGENSENLSDAFYNIASALAKEYYDDHRADIPYIASGSFL